MQYGNRVKDLISKFQAQDIAGYVIPSVDEYQSEYPSADKQRLLYITGFSGSNGAAIIFRNNGLLLTDGRYTTQAAQEVDINFFQVIDFADLGKNHNISGFKTLRIGYDPLLFTVNQLKIYKDLNLVPVTENLVDAAWTNKPKKHIKEAYIYDIKYTGKSSSDKIKDLIIHMRSSKLDHILLTDVMTICWLLNLRGHEDDSQECFSPMILARAIISSFGHIIVYVASSLDILNALKIENCIFKHENEFLSDILRLKGLISIDESNCSIGIMQHISCNVVKEKNPCILAKAKKNHVEIAQIKRVHLIESVVLCETFAWIENELKSRSLSEYEVCKKITHLRMQNDNWKFDSFPTICGYQEKSAVIH